MKRILSIDGGGIRGIIPAVVCEYIEKKSKKRISELFDLVAGTSTGGILALGLARPPNGMKASDLVQLYSDDGPTIFSNPKGFTRHLSGPKFLNEGLSKIVEKHLGDAKLSQASLEILIPAYDIKYRTPVIYTRRTALADPSQDYFMRQIALGTAAAPTYFPPFEIGDRVLIDGGLVANNPACLALMEARAVWPDEPLLLVSIGTGTLAQTIDGERAKRFGTLNWAEHVIDCMFDGTAKATEDFLAHTLSPDRYWRLQYGLNEQTENLDDASTKAIIGLKQIADSIIRDKEGRLDKLIDLLSIGTPEPPEVKEARRVLEQTHRGLQQSLEIKNRIFTLGIQNKLSELLKDATDWSAGSIRVPADDRGRFLVDLYGEAKKSVFSTRLKKFSGTFQRSSLAREILAANKKAGVPTTRVFVFDSVADVSGFDYQEMTRETEAGIDVRILIRGAASPQVEDFTIIDDSAVGVTEFVGPRDAAARWTFESSAQILVFQNVRAQLLAQSVPFADFLKKKTARYTLWTRHALKDVSEENIDSYQRLSRKFFGDEAADDSRVLEIQRRVGGIYVLERRTNSASRTVGIFSLIPVSRAGYRSLEADKLKGSEFSVEHLSAGSDSRVLAYYLGAIAGIDPRASAALTDFLLTSARELGREGVESIFARPVTDDGLRLLLNKNMSWQGPVGGFPEKNRMCRLRLT